MPLSFSLNLPPRLLLPFVAHSQLLPFKTLSSPRPPPAHSKLSSFCSKKDHPPHPLHTHSHKHATHSGCVNCCCCCQHYYHNNYHHHVRVSADPRRLPPHPSRLSVCISLRTLLRRHKLSLYPSLLVSQQLSFWPYHCRPFILHLANYSYTLNNSNIMPLC